ncbi:MAG: ferritin-like domain-containing protein [Clostridiales bacterium]|jgi:rubrerythrin|nr:ferritin-like domain-containing protein [Clostridiales bacterium]
MPWGNNHLNRRGFRTLPSGPYDGHTEQLLPDGVRIKPLDADAIKALRGMGAGSWIRRPSSVQRAVSDRQVERAYPKEQKLPVCTDNIFAASLRERIQDEHNSSRFYAYLAEHAPRGDYAGYLRRESEICGERAGKLNGLYERYAGGVFSPTETDINTQIAYGAGINWAAAVECRALQKYTRIYENAPDERCARSVFTQVCDKLSHILTLILIMLNKEITV